MHLRIFDVAKDVPTGSTFNPVLSNGSANDVSELDLSECEKDTFDAWLRKLWSEKDDYITQFLEIGTSPKKQQPVEIPLQLRNKWEIPEAYCFFAPVLVAYWLKKLAHLVL